MENAGVISLGLEALYVNEADGEVVIPLVRTGDSSTEATVEYSFKTGSALERSKFYQNHDFVNAFQKIVTFLPGETVKEVTVTIVDDKIPEID